jgi:O-antigen/teichoic acid export membrane protein
VTERDERARLSRGATLNIFGRVLRGGIQYLYLVTASRLLGADSFGVYMLGFTIVSVGEVIGRFGLDLSATRFVSMHRGVGDLAAVRAVVAKALRLAGALGGLVGAFLLVSAHGVWARAFGSPELGWVLVFLSLSVPLLSLMAVALAATQGMGEMGYSVRTQAVFHPTANLALALLFCLAGSRLGGVVAAWLLSTALAAALSLHYLRRVVPAGPAADASPAGRGPVPGAGVLLAQSAPLVLVVVLTAFLTWTDTLMLGYFRSEREVGVYSAAARTALLLELILVSVNAVFAPVIADLHHRKEGARLESLLKLTARWIYAATMPFFVLLALFAGDVMGLFGAGFADGALPLAIVAVGHFVNASTGPVGNVLVMTGHQRVMLVNSVGVFLLNVALNYVLVPRFGMVGAALATAVSIGLYNLAMLAEVYYLLRMHPYGGVFLRTTAIGALMVPVLLHLPRAFPPAATVRLAVHALLFLVVFFALVYLTCLEDEDREAIGAVMARLRRTPVAP